MKKISAASSPLPSCAAMSRRNFTRVFAEELGTGPAHSVEQMRVEAARRLLEQTPRTAEVMRRVFLRFLGTSPSQYRE